jgi:hypothetical protein
MSIMINIQSFFNLIHLFYTKQIFNNFLIKNINIKLYYRSLFLHSFIFFKYMNKNILFYYIFDERKNYCYCYNTFYINN